MRLCQEIGVCAMWRGKSFGGQCEVQACPEANGKIFDQLLWWTLGLSGRCKEVLFGPRVDSFIAQWTLRLPKCCLESEIPYVWEEIARKCDLPNAWIALRKGKPAGTFALISWKQTWGWCTSQVFFCTNGQSRTSECGGRVAYILCVMETTWKWEYILKCHAGSPSEPSVLK